MGKKHSTGRFVAIIVIQAGILLLTAGRGDLWLDEIWSLRFAASARTPWDLFRFTHDNNHLVNTLFLYLAGEGRPFVVYRLLSMASALGTLLLLGRIAGKRWGNAERILVVGLTAVSFPFILYGSEARGYAPAMFFAVAAFTLIDGRKTMHRVVNLRRVNLQQIRVRQLAGRAGAFWGVSIMGILAHSTVVMVLAALVPYAVMYDRPHTAAGGGNVFRRLVVACLYFSVPATFCVFFYLLFIQPMVVGGGPVYGSARVAGQTAAMLMGIPDTATGRTAALAGAGVILIAGSFLLYRRKDRLWVFFPLMLIVVPVLVIVITRPTFLYFRYFMVCLPFFFLLLARLLAGIYRFLGARWRLRANVIIALVTGVFITGHATRIIPLVQEGRGHYRAALTDIADRTDRFPTRIGSEHDFRNKLLIGFYSKRTGLNGKLQYVTQNQWHHLPPDWFIAHTQDRREQARQRIIVPGAGAFHLVAVYDYGGVSGWKWFVYRRTGYGRFPGKWGQAFRQAKQDTP
ncbi:MAG: hypothetical protein SWH68_16690 [Thermodesulfobacteriota bacterium]|nr:hypothetical protein [Thermodesulfobacteriota bacterium]